MHVLLDLKSAHMVRQIGVHDDDVVPRGVLQAVKVRRACVSVGFEGARGAGKARRWHTRLSVHPGQPSERLMVKYWRERGLQTLWRGAR